MPKLKAQTQGLPEHNIESKWNWSNSTNERIFRSITDFEVFEIHPESGAYLPVSLEVLRNKTENERPKIGLRGKLVAEPHALVAIHSASNDTKLKFESQKSSKAQSGRDFKPIYVSALPLSDAKKFIQELSKADIAQAFLQPVDAKGLNLVDYYDVVEKPMDLGTISKNLCSGSYCPVFKQNISSDNSADPIVGKGAKSSSGVKRTPKKRQGPSKELKHWVDPERLMDDASLVFSNCMLYNAEGSPIFESAQKLMMTKTQCWRKICSKKIVRINQAGEVVDRRRKLGLGDEESQNEATGLKNLSSRKRSPVSVSKDLIANFQVFSHDIIDFVFEYDTKVNVSSLWAISKSTSRRRAERVCTRRSRGQENLKGDRNEGVIKDSDIQEKTEKTVWYRLSAISHTDGYYPILSPNDAYRSHFISLAARFYVCSRLKYKLWDGSLSIADGNMMSLHSPISLIVQVSLWCRILGYPLEPTPEQFWIENADLICQELESMGSYYKVAFGLYDFLSSSILKCKQSILRNILNRSSPEQITESKKLHAVDNTFDKPGPVLNHVARKKSKSNARSCKSLAISRPTVETRCSQIVSRSYDFPLPQPLSVVVAAQGNEENFKRSLCTDSGNGLDHLESVSKRPLPKGKNLLGKRIEVFWSVDKVWHFGYVIRFRPRTGLHLVQYEDGFSEWCNLESGLTPDFAWNIVDVQNRKIPATSLNGRTTSACVIASVQPTSSAYKKVFVPPALLGSIMRIYVMFECFRDHLDWNLGSFSLFEFVAAIMSKDIVYGENDSYRSEATVSRLLVSIHLELISNILRASWEDSIEFQNFKGVGYPEPRTILKRTDFDLDSFAWWAFDQSWVSSSDCSILRLLKFDKSSEWFIRQRQCWQVLPASDKFEGSITPWNSFIPLIRDHGWLITNQLFLDSLFSFYQYILRWDPGPAPRLLGEPINLYFLYSVIKDLGGYSSVEGRASVWFNAEILLSYFSNELNSASDAAIGDELHQIYRRYLLEYDRYFSYSRKNVYFVSGPAFHIESTGMTLQGAPVGRMHSTGSPFDRLAARFFFRGDKLRKVEGEDSSALKVLNQKRARPQSGFKLVPKRTWDTNIFLGNNIKRSSKEWNQLSVSETKASRRKASALEVSGPDASCGEATNVSNKKGRVGEVASFENTAQKEFFFGETKKRKDLAASNMIFGAVDSAIVSNTHQKSEFCSLPRFDVVRMDSSRLPSEENFGDGVSETTIHHDIDGVHSMKPPSAPCNMTLFSINDLTWTEVLLELVCCLENTCSGRGHVSSATGFACDSKTMIKKGENESNTGGIISESKTNEEVRSEIVELSDTYSKSSGLDSRTQASDKVMEEINGGLGQYDLLEEEAKSLKFWGIDAEDGMVVENIVTSGSSVVHLASECERLLESIIMHPFAAPFVDPVDDSVAGFRTYRKYVETPLCLSQVLERLRARYYWAGDENVELEALKDDVVLVFANARKFYRIGSSEYGNAGRLATIFLDQFANIESLGTKFHATFVQKYSSESAQKILHSDGNSELQTKLKQLSSEPSACRWETSSDYFRNERIRVLRQHPCKDVGTRALHVLLEDPECSFLCGSKENPEEDLFTALVPEKEHKTLDSIHRALEECSYDFVADCARKTLSSRFVADVRMVFQNWRKYVASTFSTYDREAFITKMNRLEINFLKIIDSGPMAKIILGPESSQSISVARICAVHLQRSDAEMRGNFEPPSCMIMNSKVRKGRTVKAVSEKPSRIGKDAPSNTNRLNQSSTQKGIISISKSDSETPAQVAEKQLIFNDVDCDISNSHRPAVVVFPTVCGKLLSEIMESPAYKSLEAITSHAESRNQNKLTESSFSDIERKLNGGEYALDDSQEIGNEFARDIRGLLDYWETLLGENSERQLLLQSLKNKFESAYVLALRDHASNKWSWVKESILWLDTRESPPVLQEVELLDYYSPPIYTNKKFRLKSDFKRLKGRLAGFDKPMRSPLNLWTENTRLFDVNYKNIGNMGTYANFYGLHWVFLNDTENAKALQMKYQNDRDESSIQADTDNEQDELDDAPYCDNTDTGKDALSEERFDFPPPRLISTTFWDPTDMARSLDCTGTMDAISMSTVLKQLSTRKYAELEPQYKLKLLERLCDHVLETHPFRAALSAGLKQSRPPPRFDRGPEEESTLIRGGPPVGRPKFSTSPKKRKKSLQIGKRVSAKRVAQRSSLSRNLDSESDQFLGSEEDTSETSVVGTDRFDGELETGDIDAAYESSSRRRRARSGKAQQSKVLSASKKRIARGAKAKTRKIRRKSLPKAENVNLVESVENSDDCDALDDCLSDSEATNNEKSTKARKAELDIVDQLIDKHMVRRLQELERSEFEFELTGWDLREITDPCDDHGFPPRTGVKRRGVGFSEISDMENSRTEFSVHFDRCLEVLKTLIADESFLETRKSSKCEDVTVKENALAELAENFATMLSKLKGGLYFKSDADSESVGSRLLEDARLVFCKCFSSVDGDSLLMENVRRCQSLFNDLLGISGSVFELNCDIELKDMKEFQKSCFDLIEDLRIKDKRLEILIVERFSEDNIIKFRNVGGGLKFLLNEEETSMHPVLSLCRIENRLRGGLYNEIYGLPLSAFDENFKLSLNRFRSCNHTTFAADVRTFFSMCFKYYSDCSSSLEKARALYESFERAYANSLRNYTRPGYLWIGEMIWIFVSPGKISPARISSLASDGSSAGFCLSLPDISSLERNLVLGRSSCSIPHCMRYGVDWCFAYDHESAITLTLGGEQDFSPTDVRVDGWMQEFEKQLLFDQNIRERVMAAPSSICNVNLSSISANEALAYVSSSLQGSSVWLPGDIDTSIADTFTTESRTDVVGFEGSASKNLEMAAIEAKLYADMKPRRFQVTENEPQFMEDFQLPRNDNSERKDENDSFVDMKPPHDPHLVVPRFQPLGQDHYDNQYWYFDLMVAKTASTMQCLLFVDVSSRACISMCKDLHLAGMDYSERFLCNEEELKFVAGNSLGTLNRWLVYSSRSHIDALLTRLKQSEWASDLKLLKSLMSSYRLIVGSMRCNGIEMVGSAAAFESALEKSRVRHITISKEFFLNACAQMTVTDCPAVYGGTPLISDVNFETSPDADSMVLPGDVLLSVNGLSTAGRSSKIVANQLQELLVFDKSSLSPKANNEVILSVYRPPHDAVAQILSLCSNDVSFMVRWGPSNVLLSLVPAITPTFDRVFDLALALESQLWSVCSAEPRLPLTIQQWRSLNGWGQWNWPRKRCIWLQRIYSLHNELCRRKSSEDEWIPYITAVLCLICRSYVSTMPPIQGKVFLPSNVARTDSSALRLLRLGEGFFQGSSGLNDMSWFRIQYDSSLFKMSNAAYGLPGEAAWLNELTFARSLSYISLLASWLYVEAMGRFTCAILSAEDADNRKVNFDLSKSTRVAHWSRERTMNIRPWKRMHEIQVRVRQGVMEGLTDSEKTLVGQLSSKRYDVYDNIDTAISKELEMYSEKNYDKSLPQRNKSSASANTCSGISVLKAESRDDSEVGNLAISSPVSSTKTPMENVDDPSACKRCPKPVDRIRIANSKEGDATLSKRLKLGINLMAKDAMVDCLPGKVSQHINDALPFRVDNEATQTSSMMDCNDKSMKGVENPHVNDESIDCSLPLDMSPYVAELESLFDRIGSNDELDGDQEEQFVDIMNRFPKRKTGLFIYLTQRRLELSRKGDHSEAEIDSQVQSEWSNLSPESKLNWRARARRYNERNEKIYQPVIARVSRIQEKIRTKTSSLRKSRPRRSHASEGVLEGYVDDSLVSLSKYSSIAASRGYYTMELVQSASEFHGVVPVSDGFRAELLCPDKVIRIVGLYSHEVEAAIAFDQAARYVYPPRIGESVANFPFRETVEALGAQMPDIGSFVGMYTFLCVSDEELFS